MNYEEIQQGIREGEEAVRRIMLKNDIIAGVLIALCVILIAAMLRLIWMDWQERRERKLGRVIGGNEFVPVVTDDVQIGPDGTEYHRMGIAGRR